VSRTVQKPGGARHVSSRTYDKRNGHGLVAVGGVRNREDGQARRVSVRLMQRHPLCNKSRRVETMMFYCKASDHMSVIKFDTVLCLEPHNRRQQTN